MMMMMMMMMMTMTTIKTGLKTVPFVNVRVVFVVVVVVLFIQIWRWCVGNDHHHMHCVLWHAFSASCSMAVKFSHLHRTETPLEHFPSAISQAHPRLQVAGPCHQQWNAVTYWNPQRALHSQTAPTEMARACSSNGWWTHPQGISIRTIEDRSQESRAPGSAVQGREQTWPQSMRNSSEQLWRCHVSWCLLETVKEWGNYESWRKTSPERWREARSPQKQLHSARPPPASSAPCAVGTATRALACTVTQDVAATPPIDKRAQALSLETSSGNNLMMMIWW